MRGAEYFLRMIQSIHRRFCRVFDRFDWLQQRNANQSKLGVVHFCDTTDGNCSIRARHVVVVVTVSMLKLTPAYSFFLVQS